MRLAPLASAALLGLSVVASAQISFSSNFDAPTYATGPLAGQDGWVAGSGAGDPVAVTTLGSLSPTQSVQLSDPSNSTSFHSVARPFAPGAVTPDNAILRASADVYVQFIGAADRYFGIGFATGPFATNGYLGVALGGNGLRGGGGGYNSYNNLAGGQLQARDTLDYFGRWINVAIVADRSATTNNVTFTFSGLGTASGAATESFTRSVNFGATNLTHVQLFSDWASTSTVQGSALVDNVRFEAVPEPATMAALGLGVAALLRRRRK